MSITELSLAEGPLAAAYLLTVCALAFGIIPVTKRRLKIARNCLIGSCIIFAGIAVMWGSTTELSLIVRMVVVGMLCAAAGIGAVETSRFIMSEVKAVEPDHKQQSSQHLKPAEPQPQPQTQPEPQPQQSGQAAIAFGPGQYKNFHLSTGDIYAPQALRFEKDVNMSDVDIKLGNINTTAQRFLNDPTAAEFRKAIVEMLPRDQPIRVLCIEGDEETCAFALQVYLFLKANNFSMIDPGAARARFPGGNPEGIIVQPAPAGGHIEVVIGRKPA